MNLTIVRNVPACKVEHCYSPSDQSSGQRPRQPQLTCLTALLRAPVADLSTQVSAKVEAMVQATEASAKAMQAGLFTNAKVNQESSIFTVPLKPMHSSALTRFVKYSE
jgi:hypothetical protein